MEIELFKTQYVHQLALVERFANSTKKEHWKYVHFDQNFKFFGKTRKAFYQCTAPNYGINYEYHMERHVSNQNFNCLQSLRPTNFLTTSFLIVWHNLFSSPFNAGTNIVVDEFLVNLVNFSHRDKLRDYSYYVTIWIYCTLESNSFEGLNWGSTIYYSRLQHLYMKFAQSEFSLTCSHSVLKDQL